MQLGWKVLIPINLVWILAVTAIRVLRDRDWPAWEATAIPLAVVLLLVVVPALMIYEGASARKAADRADEEEEAAELRADLPDPAAGSRRAQTATGAPARRRERAPDPIPAGGNR